MKGSTKVKLVVFIALLAAAAIPMAAQTPTVKSGTLNISGVVPEIFELTVTPASDAANLTLTAVVTVHPIATIKERSNKKVGYTLVLTTTNNSTFKGTVSGETLAYTLKYAGNPVSFSLGSATLSNPTVKTTSSGSSNPLTISFDGDSNFLSEDTYTDTLSLTMTSK
ncbi:MAG: hypothetical protein WCL50_05745 [Spirochaetota bacterium]